MSSLPRRVGMLILIALLINPIMLFAQDSAPVTVVGSGIPAPLISEFASAAGVTVDVNVTGTNAGFAALCAGEADVTTATRSISAAEETACAESSVSYLEFILGYDVMAVIANPSVPATCLDSAQLNSIFAPSSSFDNWNQVNVANASLPLSLFVPADNTTAYALLDGVVEGVGFRADAAVVADGAEIVSSVSSTEGSLGVVSLPVAEAAGDQVKILELSTTSAGCAAPSAESASGRTYTSAYPLYAYANSATVEATQPLFEAAFSTENAAAFTGLDLVPPTDAGLTLSAEILANLETGRQVSQDTSSFSIPQNLVGTINIAGSPTGSSYLTSLTGTFVQAYPGVVLNQAFVGQPDGVAQLCAGSVDFITAFSELSSEDQALCAENNIPTETLALGSQPVVLIGNGEFLTCLTTAEVAAVWGAASEDTVTNWNQVNASFPDLPLTLVSTSVGDSLGDILMLTSTGQNLPTREDFAETNTSAAYLATAVGNVEGAMTYLSWQAYQGLSAEAKASIQLVGVDAGSGCVTPSAATVADSTYALARPLLLLINRLSLARTEVQSLIWTLVSDENYSQLSGAGYVGLSFADLPALRDQLQQTFVLAAEEAAQAALTPEATPEATAEATAEVTPEATQGSE